MVGGVHLGFIRNNSLATFKDRRWARLPSGETGMVKQEKIIVDDGIVGFKEQRHQEKSNCWKNCVYSLPQNMTHVS